MKITLNGAEKPLEAETPITALLESQGYAGKLVAVAVNGTFVPRTQHKETIIKTATRSKSSPRCKGVKLMTNEVIINAKSTLALKFHGPEFDSKGVMQKYSVTITAPHFFIRSSNKAPLRNPSIRFFEEMNKEWKGWQGLKVWDAMTGEYSMSASFKPTGLILLVADINSQTSNTDWKSTLALPIEPGQLDNYTEKLETFSPLKIKRKINV